MDTPNETDRLRALVTLMREGGLTRLQLADGTVLERPPLSPFEAAALVVGKTSGTASSDGDDLDELDADERKAEAEEADAERSWNEFWARSLASSGSAVPKFPGVEKAARFLSRRH